jgi:hypothetical protein
MCLPSRCPVMNYFGFQASCCIIILSNIRTIFSLSAFSFSFIYVSFRGVLKYSMYNMLLAMLISFPFVIEDLFSGWLQKVQNGIE